MYKGFDKDLKCRGFQYEEGKEYIHEGTVEVCEGGFHACENPFDVFEHYPPNDFHRFCAVEGSGKEDTRGNKTSFEKLKIKVELGLSGLIKEGVQFCLDRVKWTDGASATGDYSGASATGYTSGASATGNYSRASATGNCSGAYATGNYSGASATGHMSGASATGYKSRASVGKGSVALSVGRDTRAKGSIGSWLVLTQCHHDDTVGEDFIDLVKVAKVDGKRIKADTWYTLKEGKFVLAGISEYE